MFDQAAVGMALVGLDGKWLEVNRRLCEMTGYCREELLALTVREITWPSDVALSTDALARFASGDSETSVYEKRYVHKDGRIVWARVSVSQGRNGTGAAPVSLIAVIDDITEYKLALERQHKAEEKCSKAFRRSPLAITLTSARDHRYLEVNDAFERMSGYTRDEVIGRSPFDLNLWVDPPLRYELIDRLLAGEHVSEQEYQFRTRDGAILTCLGSAELMEVDGEPCMLAAALDITDRKKLEIELQELSGHLIQAQDAERRRIAAELTDSLGQSIAVVSFEASLLARTARGELSQELQSLSAKIQDIASGIGIISQSLYPAGLDYTGLPWAIEGLCRQSTHLYGLQLAFRHEGIPASLPAAVSLCLYRIVQEGLRNVLLHSGTRDAWIELTGDRGSVHLELWDKGVGSDPASLKSGLGLLTMRERCRRLNGTIAIHSQNGVRIEVRIPLSDGDSPSTNLPDNAASRT